MKKLKGIKGVLIGVFVVAAALCVFAACSSDKDSADDTPITEMSLSIDNVKRTYLTYQSFSTDGLEATVKRESGNEETISAAYLDVDNSAFDNTTAGEYTIVVSYSEGGVTLSESYDVEVIEEITGLSVKKDTVDYTIAEGASGVNISTSDIKVYAVDKNGVSSTALSSGAYETKYFKGGEEITSLNNVGVGVYTIYAYRDVSIEGKFSSLQYTCAAYVFCYVKDPIETIELDKEATSSVFTQEASKIDQMSATWVFKITYDSGIVGTVSGAEMEISNLVTTKTGENKTATATYVERIKTSTEEEIKSHTVSVEYTISGIADDLYGLVEVYNFNDIYTGSEVTYTAGSVLMDTFTTVGSVKTGSSTYGLADIPVELEDLELKGRVQINSSNKLQFSMILPGTVTIYGICGTGSDDNTTTLTLAGDNDAGASATWVAGGENGALHKNAYGDSEKYVTYECTAGDYVLSASGSTNIMAIVIKYDTKEEIEEKEKKEATNEIVMTSFGKDLTFENIDLNLPQKYVGTLVERNKNQDGQN
ncbi:MAG: bacterial Ig-like domain-containing protein [Clostridia bacterium]|nr:bacterial Ig-like domain-containing protein [Clostridia bacterium]